VTNTPHFLLELRNAGMIDASVRTTRKRINEEPDQCGTSGAIFSLYPFIDAVGK
jgi:hypothetical protein